jgi:hypothetical protein
MIDGFAREINAISGEARGVSGGERVLLEAGDREHEVLVPEPDMPHLPQHLFDIGVCGLGVAARLPRAVEVVLHGFAVDHGGPHSGILGV